MRDVRPAARSGLAGVHASRVRLLARAQRLSHSPTRSPDEDRLPVGMVAATVVDSLRTIALRTGGTVAPPVDLGEALSRAGLGSRPADPAAAAGWLWAARGAAGELATTQRLLAGTVPVPDGTRTVELLGFRTPGADLALHAVDGTTTFANVKMAAGAAPLVDHFAAHPDVPIVYASTEAAADAAVRGLQVTAHPTASGGPQVVDTGLSVSRLDALLSSDGAALDSTVDSSGDGDGWPWLLTAAVVWRARQRWRRGATPGAVASDAARDMAQGAAGMASAQVAAALGAPVLLAAATAGGVTAAAGSARHLWADLRVQDDQIRHALQSIAGLLRP